MGLFSGILGFIGANKAAKDAKKAHARDAYNNSPQGIRANAELAGFNPLTVLNSGRSFGAGYAPQFGNALGQLGQGLDDFVSGREQIKIQRAELELERQRIDKLAKAVTMGPPIPGIYGARDATGTTVRGGAARTIGAGVDSVAGDRAGHAVSDISGSARPTEYNDVTAPAFTAFGVPFYGSGNWTGGQTFEDAVGEGPLTWLNSGFVLADTVAYTGAYYARRAWDNARVDQATRDTVVRHKRPDKPRAPVADYPPLRKKTERRKHIKAMKRDWWSRAAQSFKP